MVKSILFLVISVLICSSRPSSTNDSNKLLDNGASKQHGTPGQQQQGSRSSSASSNSGSLAVSKPHLFSPDSLEHEKAPVDAKSSPTNDGAKKRVNHPPGTPDLSPLSSSTSPPSQPRNATQTVNENITANFQRINSGALLRGFYVFVGLSVIVVMYLVVRSIRLRRKVTRVHKYGILANREDVEMTPLGAEDDDDDTVVFDLSNHPPT